MIKKDKEITEVMFRKEKRKDGDIYAVFPYLSWKHNYEVMGYAHLGQHQSCKWEYVVCNTKPAKPKEYADLYRELRSIGYRLKVIKRANHKRMYQL